MKSQLLRILLLVAASAMATVQAYITEQVESRPIDGHKFVEGQQFRFACRAVGNSDLSLRMICPMTKYAPASIVSDACFENCGRPLCNQPGLHDCSTTMPELKDARCVRSISLLTDGSQEIRIEYTFPQATVRMGGTYSCQYKNMRSSVQLFIEATTTTSTTSTTATTRTSTTSTPSTSTTRRITTPAPTTTRPTTKTTQGKSGVVQPTSTVPSVPVDNNDRSLDTDRNQGKTDSSATVQPMDRTDKHELLMKTGWFYNSLVGKLAGIDLILIVLLIVLATVLLVGCLFIRCQVAAIGRSSGDAAPPKRPLHQCCAKLLCITVDNGGGSSKANGHNRAKELPPNHNQPQKQNQRLMKAPPIQPFSNGSDTASGQVYSEANLDSSYYSQGEAPDSRDAEYRLQTHFDAADARAYPMVSGSQRGPRVGGSFFNRDAPDRHSFNNVRASRQRPAIPVDLLMRANGSEVEGGEAGGAGPEEIRQQVEKQRREIDNLRQLLRDSQQQLSRLASSQQELNRSVSVTRMPTAASSATTPDEAPSGISPTDPQGDYELLARASSVNPPTVQTSSGDLLQLAIDEPIQEEEADDEYNGPESQESLQYPTVRSANKRRGSIGEAYESGRLCPA